MQIEQAIVPETGGNNKNITILRFDSIEQLGTEDLELIASEFALKGAVLLRFLEPPTADNYRRLLVNMNIDFADDYNGVSPRTKVGGNLFTSTKTPGFLTIPPHTEMAYLNRRPGFISFFCKQPSEKYGETPIIDNRRFLHNLEIGIRMKIQTLGLCYRRVYTRSGTRITKQIGWEHYFGSTKKEEIAKICQSRGISYEWLDKDTLVTWTKVNPLVIHPDDGKIYLNMNLFHLEAILFERAIISSRVSWLQNWVVKRLLKRSFTKKDIFISTFFGDRSSISKSEALTIHGAMWRSAQLFPWMQGDIVLLDNIKVSHGRLNVKGPREILTTLGNMYDLNEDGSASFSS